MIWNGSKAYAGIILLEHRPGFAPRSADLQSAA